MSRALVPVIIIIAVAARIAVGVSLDTGLRFPDSHDYARIAENILAGDGPRLNERTVANRGPGYSYFLAGIIGIARVAAPDARLESSPGLVIVIRIVQALISGALCWIVYRIGRRLFSPEAGMAAAAVAALDPVLAYFSVLVLSEMLFAALLAGAVLCLLKTGDGGMRWAVACGVLLGLSALVRPPVLLLIPVLLGVWLAVNRSRTGIRTALAAGIVALAVISPWPIRNYRLTGRPVFTTLSAGASLYEGTCPEADGGPAMEKITWPAEIAGMNEVEKNGFLRAKAVGCMRADPIRMIRLAGSKLARFWNIFPNFGTYRQVSYMAVSALHVLPVMVCVAIGLALWRGRPAAAVVLAVPAVYFSLLHMVFVGSIRYRAPVMPLLGVFAGAGIVAVLRRFHVMRRAGGSRGAEVF